MLIVHIIARSFFAIHDLIGSTTRRMRRRAFHSREWGREIDSQNYNLFKHTIFADEKSICTEKQIDRQTDKQTNKQIIIWYSRLSSEKGI